MVTEYVNEIELAAAKSLLSQPLINRAFIAGGCLLRKDSKDVDILVQTVREPDFDDVLGVALQEYSREDIYRQYGPEDHGKYWIVKYKPDDPSKSRPIDVLYCNTIINNQGVVKYMNTYFPFSIQCVAYDVLMDNLYGDLGYHTDTIYCNANVTSESDCLKKYKKYYPNAKFLGSL